MKAAPHPHTKPLVFFSAVSVGVFGMSLWLWSATPIKPGNAAAAAMARPIAHVRAERGVVVLDFDQFSASSPASPATPRRQDIWDNQAGTTYAAATLR